jgi:hypothetical protein
MNLLRGKEPTTLQNFITLTLLSLEARESAIWMIFGSSTLSQWVGPKYRFPKKQWDHLPEGFILLPW